MSVPPRSEDVAARLERLERAFARGDETLEATARGFQAWRGARGAASSDVAGTEAVADAHGLDYTPLDDALAAGVT
ncbi:MAG TPA: hypothetical protein VI409_08200 [Gaiellaceae bacterium]|nr:hypothetical protein [Gaiellaceae bacterium]